MPPSVVYKCFFFWQWGIIVTSFDVAR
uniref:Uncharacterized protein n=1 Tax=Zea mays TaxID=4577 RepID=C4J782_MAIZE|nr:unknown [Zea mays]